MFSKNYSREEKSPDCGELPTKVGQQLTLTKAIILIHEVNLN